jgi:hypothetical protein
MDRTNDISYEVPFTSDSNLSVGFHVSASLGGGAPHAFQVDTGSVGILAPRQTLGPNYQNFDPTQDIEFGYISSGKVYWGQWVKVPAVLGVPADWDGTGDYPIAHVEVFAVDQPAEFDRGVFGIGFAIGGLADGGPARNPLLHVTYQGAHLGHGYIISTQGITVGLTSTNRDGFSLISLDRDPSGNDWMQPPASVSLTGDFSADGFSTVLPLLVDTGIDKMILWLSAENAPPNLPSDSAFPGGNAITVSTPTADPNAQPALQYSFLTGDGSQPMAPSSVEWRVGNGINTGRNVLAGADYLYDAKMGQIGFRVPSE